MSDAPRPKQTELSDLPAQDGEGVRGGASLEPCLRPEPSRIPCIKTSPTIIPCVRRPRGGGE